MRTADKFTFVRVVFAPIFLIVYIVTMSSHSPLPWFGEHASAVLLVLTAMLILVEITDYLDGNTARKLKQVSDTGKLFDPFADAQLHITTFFCFAYSGLMPAIFFMIIFYREFGMMFLRMMTLKKGIAIAARPGGKLKTVLYIFSCFWTLAVLIYERSGLFKIPVDRHFRTVCVVLFAVCALAALVSLADYLAHFVFGIKKK